MSDETTAQPAVAQPAEAASSAPAETANSDHVARIAAPEPADSDTSPTADTKAEKSAEAEGSDIAHASATNAPATIPSDIEPSTADVAMKDKPTDDTAQADPEGQAELEKPADVGSDSARLETPTGPVAGSFVAEGDATTSSGDKLKARRKSSGVVDSKSKKLNKKASKAKILHTDAQPGEHYFAKLKGFPPWPVVVCDEEMLPPNMKNSRPVTAARPDGTYREDFADGGKRIADRTFAVMYLHTNEFSWTPNTDLSELDPEIVAGLVTPKMRKDLQQAHLLAAEQNDLPYYKRVLEEFEEQRLEKVAAAEAKKAAKAKTPKKANKLVEVDEDGDIEMAEIEDGDEAENAEKKPKTKKRKAEDDSVTPQRSDSVKKPKIKLTNSSTPKATNGVQSPTGSGTKESSQAVKVKAKPAKSTKDGEKKEKGAAVPKEPEATPAELHARREKEILFLRHRLQKGLLLRDQEPKAEEMKSMSDFLSKLELCPDLQVSIIRATKINKVLKAILKLETIPKEEEFQFKTRSQALLDKWNKLLAVESAAPASANGVNDSAPEAVKTEKGPTNGVKESAEKKTEAEKESAKPDTVKASAEESATKADPSTVEKPAAENNHASETVESTE